MVSEPMKLDRQMKSKKLIRGTMLAGWVPGDLRQKAQWVPTSALPIYMPGASAAPRFDE